MEDYQWIFLYSKVQITELMLNDFNELPNSTYTRNIHQIFITTPSMFKNYSKPMNGQVIATPFWFASVGNCSSIMTLWKEVVVNKLSGEFCLTEILLEKIEKVLEIWRWAHFKTLNWIKHGVEGFLTSCCFLETLCAAFFKFLQRSWVFIHSDVLY